MVNLPVFQILTPSTEKRKITHNVYEESPVSIYPNADILKDKRKIDKYNMELEDKISGRNVTDDMNKKRHKNEERKMRIKYEKNVAYLKHQGVIFMEKIANEEAKSKEVLDEKLKLEQELLDLKEDLQKIIDKNAFNREELIKNKVKNSQLDSQGI